MPQSSLEEQIQKRDVIRDPADALDRHDESRGFEPSRLSAAQVHEQGDAALDLHHDRQLDRGSCLLREQRDRYQLVPFVTLHDYSNALLRRQPLVQQGVSRSVTCRTPAWSTFDDEDSEQADNCPE